MQLKPIDQQVVVVFGASSGIGRVTAKQFAERGAKVVVAARNEAGLASLVNEIQAMGGTAVAQVADAGDFAQVQAVADRAVREFGRLDTWAHLASVTVYATFEQTTPEEFKQIIETNLVGQAYGAMAALPHLRREGGGALIHVSSVEAHVAFPYHSAYAASKHGIPGFLDALRLELKKEGVPISVTNIMPATINTPFFSKARTKLGVKPNAPPPVYPPSTVADQILYAAAHPQRDMIAGGSGKLYIQTQKISPRVMDALLLAVGFRLQRTEEPKGADAPNNLFEPVDDNRVDGDYGSIAFRHSAYNWLGRHPGFRRTLVGVALGAAALVGARALGNES